MYTRINKHTWTGRVDHNEGNFGLRWHQVVTIIDLGNDELSDLENDELSDLEKEEIGIVVIGFKSDEGVLRNEGRIGAKEGPDTLRKACCNFANHFDQKTQIADAGNVICENNDLETAQKELRELISKIVNKGYFPFVFGGGHEVALPHFTGLFDAIPPSKNIGIINIDAHFDLRKPDAGSTSGTPFFQISEICLSKDIPFNYFCIGIQKSANTKALFKRADSLGVKYMLANEINEASLSKQNQKINDFIAKVDYIYLTICLDVFDISIAPGVSAPSVSGLFPNITLEIIKNIIRSGKLITANIAELNPSLDQDEKTSKLAAKLVYEIITDYQELRL